MTVKDLLRIKLELGFLGFHLTGKLTEYTYEKGNSTYTLAINYVDYLQKTGVYTSYVRLKGTRVSFKPFLENKL